MNITILFFAKLASETARESLALQLPEGSTVEDAMRLLVQRYQPISDLHHQIALAVNMEYVGQGHALSDGDELALIPPVSGG